MSISTKPILECTSRRDLADLLDIKVSTLTYYAYGGGKKYKTFEIPKKSGGTRQITSPVDGLKTIQRKIALLLNEVYPKPDYVQGFVAGRSVIKNASIHLNRKVILNIDLADFFDSITDRRIIGLLRSKPFNFNNEVASTIAGLTCYNGRLPQGAPTSPILSNMICLRMDRELYQLAKNERAYYSRYADDITISTRRSMHASSIISECFGERSVTLGKELLEIINKNYFELNFDKTRAQYGVIPKYVTGVKVCLLPNLSKTYVREIRSMLHAWEKFGLENAQRVFCEKYGGGNRKLDNVVAGKISYLKNIKGVNDLTYRRLYNRYVRLLGSGLQEMPESEIEELYNKVFVISSGKNYGSGFVLDGKWLITCDHVINGGKLSYFLHSEWAMPNHKQVTLIDEWRSDEEHFDLVAVPLGGFDKQSQGKTFGSPGQNYEVTVGQKLKVIGFPLYSRSVEPMIMSVEVTGFRTDKYGIKNAHVDKKMVSGNSGGPVLDENNRLVGVVRRGTKDFSTGDDSIGYSFLPIQEIRKFLNNLPN